MLFAQQNIVYMYNTIVTPFVIPFLAWADLDQEGGGGTGGLDNIVYVSLEMLLLTPLSPPPLEKQLDPLDAIASWRDLKSPL